MLEMYQDGVKAMILPDSADLYWLRKNGFAEWKELHD